jgi:hypothetical protein
MKFFKGNLLGIWNIVLALVGIIDKLIEKGTITPLPLFLWTGCLLSGIYIIYENSRKNKVEKKH